MALICFLAVVFLWSNCIKIGSCTLVAPQSANATLGQEATFTCAGESYGMVWTINNENVEDFGIEPTNELLDGVRWSNITVIGSIENNLALIQCVLVVSLNDSKTSPFPPVFLTVLGIGPVGLPTLASAPCVKWDEPEFMSADVTHLIYNLSVSGADSSSLNVMTNETQHCTELTPCQEYTVTVTPFSTAPDYTGNSMTITDNAPGDTPHFQGPCVAEIEFENADSVTCIFSCLLTKPKISCPLQILHVTINEHFSDESEVPPKMSSVTFGGEESLVVLNVTGLPAREKFYSNFLIESQDGDAVDMESTLFSTYDVQNASFVYPNKTVVEVTCFFAVHTSVTSCVVVFESSFLGLSFNGSIQRSVNLSLSSTGYIDIPQELFQHGYTSTAIFDAKVYAANKNGNIILGPAFEQIGALVIHSDQEEPSDTSTTTTSIIGSSSPSTTAVMISQVWMVCGIIASIVVLLLVLVLLMLLIMYHYKRSVKKQIQGAVISPADLTTPMAVVMDTTKELYGAPDTASGIVCLRSAAYEVVSQNQGLHGVPDTASDITCLRSAAYEIVPQKAGLHGVPDTASDIACVKSAAYDVASQNAGLHRVPDTASDIACIKSAAYEVVSQKPSSRGRPETTSDIVCVKSVAYEAAPQKPPVYDYVLVNGVHPKSSSKGPSYAEVGPSRLDVSAVHPELDGAKESYSSVRKQTNCDVNVVDDMPPPTSPDDSTC